MKTTNVYLTLLITALLLIGNDLMAQKATETNNVTSEKTPKMKTYLIEREIPDAGKLSPEELKGISKKSCSVLDEMGPRIQWQHSYVSGNKIYCIYKAENEELVKEHAKKGGFPANTIVQVSTMISPETAN